MGLDKCPPHIPRAVRVQSSTQSTNNQYVPSVNLMYDTGAYPVDPTTSVGTAFLLRVRLVLMSFVPILAVHATTDDAIISDKQPGICSTTFIAIFSAGLQSSCSRPVQRDDVRDAISAANVPCRIHRANCNVDVVSHGQRYLSKRCIR